MTCISRDMGGCGEAHPYEIGPAGYPQIDCSLCETVLEKDPNHARLPSEVPETHDEHLTREDWEKRGAADQQYIQAMAMAKFVGLEIPESLTRVIGPRRTALPGSAKCPSGHEVSAGAKFCPECAAPMVPEIVRCGDGHPNSPKAKYCAECAAPMGDLLPLSVVPDTPEPVAGIPGPSVLKNMRAEDLRAACTANGLDATGTRAAMIARLRSAR